MVVAGSSAGADASLVGLWHLDEGSGSIAADSSGRGNDGTMVGPTWVPGRIGSALSFNGQSGRVEVVDNASLEPTAAVSGSAWIERAGNPGFYRYLVAKGAMSCIAASHGLYSGAHMEGRVSSEQR